MASNIRTFIFDIDGTLIDTYKASVTTLRQALHDIIGQDYTDDELSFHFGITLDDTLRRLRIEENNFHAIASRIDELYYGYKNRLTIFGGIEQMLETLSKKDVTIGIVTSKRRDEFENDFKDLSISKYFKVVVCDEDTSKHKPFPDPIEKFLEITGTPKGEAIYIGDTAYDYHSAHAAGIAFGLAMWGAIDKNIEAEHFFDKPSDILKLI